MATVSGSGNAGLAGLLACSLFMGPRALGGIEGGTDLTPPDSAPIAIRQVANGPKLTDGPTLQFDVQLQDCSLRDEHAAAALIDLIELAWCKNPRSRRAWALVKASEAQVKLSEAAYVPTASFDLQGAKGVTDTILSRASYLNFNSVSSTSEPSFQLKWVLIDFGQRGANLRGAREAVRGSLADEDEAIRTVFVDTVSAYYNLQSTISAYDAKRRAVQTAKEVLDVATAKLQGGVVSPVDELQARVSYSSAQLDLSKASGDVSTARAVLGGVIGLEEPYSLEITALPPIDAASYALGPLDDLLTTAKANHPQLVSARSRVIAAEANVAAARTLGRPTVSLVGSWSRSNEYPNPQYSIDISTRVTARSIGLQLDVPLLSEFSRAAEINIARAQQIASEQDLKDTELSISLDVQKNYIAASVAAEGVELSNHLAAEAHQAFDVVSRRYRGGIGKIIDVLTAQATLATSEAQQVSAAANWLSARLNLNASVGRLELALPVQPEAATRDR